MKNIILKIAAVTFLGAVMPLSACHMGGTDMNAENLDENVKIVKEAEDCPGKGCPAPDGKECPDDDEKPHAKPPHKGGKRRKRHGRIVRPIPEPIEDQPR